MLVIAELGDHKTEVLPVLAAFAKEYDKTDELPEHNVFVVADITGLAICKTVKLTLSLIETVVDGHAFTLQYNLILPTSPAPGV